VIAQGGKRPDRAAELEGERLLANLGELVAGVFEDGQPSRRLEAEGDRERLLQERPPGHERVPVTLGQRGRGRGRAVEVGDERLERAVRHEHERAVEHVLTGRPHVEVGAGRFGQTGAQRGEQARDRRALRPGLAAELDEVERARVSDRAQLLGRLGGREPADYEGSHQGKLDIEQCLQDRPVGGGRRRRAPGEQTREETPGLGGHRSGPGSATGGRYRTPRLTPPAFPNPAVTPGFARFINVR
jgi:hypothetical protein